MTRRRLPSAPWLRDPSSVTGALLVALILAPLYAWTITSSDQVNIDANVAAIPAWHLVQHGTVDLSDSDVGDGIRFIGPGAKGRVLSNRPLLLSLLAVPAYVVANDDEYSVDPSSITALLVTVAAMALMYSVLRRVVDHRWSLLATLALALATATWPISAGELWPHGAGQLVVALALLTASSGRHWLTGLAWALGLLVRPVTMIIPGALALQRFFARGWRSTLAIGAPVAAALALLVIYNAWMFGSPNVNGGYGSGYGERAVSQSLSGYFATLGDMFASPENGLFVWSPICLFAVVGLPRAWSSIPRWSQEAAVAGLIYLIVHARLNRASGGLLLDYRYPIEAVTLAAPALAIGAKHLVSQGRPWRTALLTSLGVSMLLQGLMATSYSCDHTPGERAGSCSLL